MIWTVALANSVLSGSLTVIELVIGVAGSFSVYVNAPSLDPRKHWRGLIYQGPKLRAVSEVSGGKEQAVAYKRDYPGVGHRRELRDPATSTVPAAVPSDFHNSQPLVPSLALKNNVPLTLVRYRGNDVACPRGCP